MSIVSPHVSSQQPDFEYCVSSHTVSTTHEPICAQCIFDLSHEHPPQPGDRKTQKPSRTVKFPVSDHFVNPQDIHRRLKESARTSPSNSGLHTAGNTSVDADTSARQDQSGALTPADAALILWALALSQQLTHPLWDALLDRIAAAPPETLDKVCLVLQNPKQKTLGTLCSDQEGRNPTEGFVTPTTHEPSRKSTSRQA
jgi:hypothetical protein